MPVINTHFTAARDHRDGKRYVTIVAGGNGTLDDRAPDAEALAVFALP